MQLERIGDEGRNRPDFPDVAVQKCLIRLDVQGLPVLSAPIIFNRFGIRLTYANELWNRRASMAVKE